MTEGQGKIGGAMLPPPEGLWGMPTRCCSTIPGYDPDVKKNREEAREIMKKLGYGPDKQLELKVSTRNVPTFRDPAVILIDQLKEIYVDAELETIETANWFPKVVRKDYAVALNNTGSGVDDPDQQFYENYACGSRAQLQPATAIPSSTRSSTSSRWMTDQEERKKLVWEIDRKLQEDGARPIIFHTVNATCMQPAGQGADDHGQQHLQRLADGRRLARPVARLAGSQLIDAANVGEEAYEMPAASCGGGRSRCWRRLGRPWRRKRAASCEFRMSTARRACRSSRNRRSSRWRR